MKRAYPEAALLRLRQVALDRAKAKLFEKGEFARSQEERLEGARQDLERARRGERDAIAKQEKRRAAGSTSISDEVAFEEYRYALAADIVQQVKHVDECERQRHAAAQEVTLAREELTTALAELRVIELHHQRFLAAEAKQAERAEEEEQDERATFDVHRRRS